MPGTKKMRKNMGGMGTKKTPVMAKKGKAMRANMGKAVRGKKKKMRG